MKKIVFLLCTLYFVLCTFASASPSPVVQIISYKEPLGMYFSLQGWGSGSIVDSAGRILTNSHVVDDGFSGISDDFSVCMTDNPSLPPKCHYTASVISRNVAKDIAMLQIDPTDIFGGAVNFSTFTTIPLDYSYVPNSGDSVIARGYPWVGANTITETQGIVSGTYNYNNNSYIKTDTLIAGGNSGGPLIRDGKVVGINTFLIGGSSDPSLGYSLSIREAQEFIQAGLSSAQKIQENSPKFPLFLQTLDSFNQKQKVEDSLVTIKLAQKYNITSYIPGTFIEGEIAEENSTGVYAFSFMHFNTPRLQTPEEIRYFLASQSFFPFSQDVKFRTVTLGGHSFYAVDVLGNTGGDKTKTEYVYFKIINQEHLILLQLSAPFATGSTYTDIQKNLTTFLSGISFPRDFSFPTPSQIDIAHADVGVKPGAGSLVDFRSNFFPYNGVISDLMATYDDLFTMRTYLGNLWSYAQISIVPNSFYTADTSASELLSKLNEVSYFSQNTESRLITYRGHEGFLVCDTDNWSTVTDEKKSTHTVSLCEAILLIGDHDSHFLSLIFLIDKNKKSDISTLMVEYLDRYIATGDGVTDFGTTSQKIAYTDVDNQSPEFQDALKNLIKYGILTPRKLFDGDSTLTWEEYARLHVWSVYHKRLTDRVIPDDSKSPTFETVLGQLPVARNALVNSEQRDDFELMLTMKLAGVSLPHYTEESLVQFKSQKDTRYRSDWQKIEDFEYIYFLGQKMSPNGGSYYNSGYYTPRVRVSYNPVTGISREPVLNTLPLKFGSESSDSKIQQYLTHELSCTRSSSQYFSGNCFKKRQEYIWSLLSYPVLTKGEAINALVPSIDFALWDEALARKKMVQIEEGNSED